eukprot:3478276-Karenia_brevis.AAC.1
MPILACEDTGCLHVLLEARADLEARCTDFLHGPGSKNATALYANAFKGNADMVKVLVDAKAALFA